MPTQATLSQEELASQYGFALSFMRQDKVAVRPVPAGREREHDHGQVHGETP